MAKAIINIKQCVQDIHDISTNQDESVMKSRIFFDLIVGDKIYDNIYVEVQHPYGADYQNEPLEVTNPIGYNGPFDHCIFKDEVEKYYRSLFGKSGRAMKVEGENTRMRDNIV